VSSEKQRLQLGSFQCDAPYTSCPRPWVTSYAVQNVGKAIEPQPTITINQERMLATLQAQCSTAEQEALAALRELSRKWRARAAIRSYAKPLNIHFASRNPHK
jgi:hypothetical protein